MTWKWLILGNSTSLSPSATHVCMSRLLQWYHIHVMRSVCMHNSIAVNMFKVSVSKLIMFEDNFALIALLIQCSLFQVQCMACHCIAYACVTNWVLLSAVLLSIAMYEDMYSCTKHKSLSCYSTCTKVHVVITPWGQILYTHCFCVTVSLYTDMLKMMLQFCQASFSTQWPCSFSMNISELVNHSILARTCSLRKRG